jgi:hypothetical protein
MQFSDLFLFIVFMSVNCSCLTDDRQNNVIDDLQFLLVIYGFLRTTDGMT